MKKEGKSKYGTTTIEMFSVLIGTIIGAGILGLPYVISRSGLILGIFYLLIIGILISLMYLYLGEVCLRTKKIHQLAGYAEKYLGKNAKMIMLAAAIFGEYSALTAYLIGEGQSFSYIFTGSQDYVLLAGLIFWIIFACISYVGLTALKKIEKYGVFGIILIVFGIFAYFLNKINIGNITLASSNLKDVFRPIGVILFAYLGFGAIPEMRRLAEGQEGKMKKVILIGSIFPIIVYSIFAFAMVGFLGKDIPEISTLALGKTLIWLGIFTMATSFLSLAIALRDMFRFDFGISRTKAWAISVFVPLFIFLMVQIFQLAGFIDILGIGGSISGGITGILIILMLRSARKKSERKPEYKINIGNFLEYLLIILFIIGVVLEIAF